MRVSIHAPARGATAHNTVLFNYIEVSIHAPARGATGTHEVFFGYHEFQSTPLHEGRHALANKALAAIAVSIHAPARGATCYLDR